MRTPTAGRALLVSACLVSAGASFGLALWIYTDVSMFGFPDGYLTDYQRAARTPLRITGWTGAALGLVFLAVAFRSGDARGRAWAVAFVVLLLVAAAALVGVPWYFGTHLGLDNGIGG
ncbi:hypothetical protein MJO55_19750 [Mycolicibacterium rufum]|uniref:Uncharacterized protein n=1 Tax=Mycolicibacterium rufum TaxID=318424 RepID=A0A9X2Y9U9_9MYCO|nr:hypothetical protein [Mycolicibacterium rufum]KGI69295.1 hypothetical protein EU78_19725 [Mycolicibacterium rufum]MCV7069843.1 hypothetical protein [Mycolicibacterium rufum]ULP35486.1 hypothetical protein MJO55_19750 [Mycolicibacterium rufum]